MSVEEKDRSSGSPQGGSSKNGTGSPPWLIWVIIATVALVAASVLSMSNQPEEPISFTDFRNRVANGDVRSVVWNNIDAQITGETKSGEKFTTTGPAEPPEDLITLLDEQEVKVEFTTPTANFFVQLIPLMLPIFLIIGFFVWMNRRAQGQVGGIMSIGRSKAKTYTTERPGTMFSDVAGYEGVKTSTLR